MGAMRRGVVHAGAWALATGAAVTLSWFGVRSVLTSSAYDPPRALPILGTPSSGAAGTGSTTPSSTQHSSPSAGSGATPRSARTTPSGQAHGTGSQQTPPSPTSPSEAGTIHSYSVTGGRVALDLGTSSATLVSATPDSGWSMQVWKQPQWIRVDFTSGNQASSVFCTWNGHPPMVQTSTG